MTIASANILDKASRLYRKYGIRSVTMSDIAGELGISKKTLYQYIPDKKTLIDRVLEADYSRIEAMLKKALNTFDHPIRQFIEIRNSIIRVLADQSGVKGFELRKYSPEKYNFYFKKYISLFTNILGQNLSRGIESGVYRENLDATVIVNTHIAIMLCTMDHDPVKWRNYLSEKHSVESLRYHLRAIVNKEYIDTIDTYLKTIKPVLS